MSLITGGLTLTAPPVGPNGAPGANSSTVIIGTYSGNKYVANNSGQITVTETRDLLPLLHAGWQ